MEHEATRALNHLSQPFPWEFFVTYVLVPETGIHLIMEDKQVKPEEAEIIMEQSSAYGVEMYPEN